jgi:hypothetical protein
MPEGSILPWWALTISAMLFPLDFLCWKLSKTRGYDIRTDTWLIEGMRYSAVGLRMLANAQGKSFRITRTGDTVTLERIE